MSELNKDAILELFDFNNKKVLYCGCDKTHIQGLINRGADVWLQETEKECIVKLEIESNYKQKINFINKNLMGNFDYLIASDFEYKKLNEEGFLLAKKHIVTIAGKTNVIKLFLRLNSSFNNKNKILYSVVPSLNNIKLIIPEQFNLPIQRYWTLRSLNLLISVKLIIEWLFIRNNLLRKLFADKLIVVK